MALYREVTVNVKLLRGGVLTQINRGFIRVTKSTYTLDQIVAGVSTSVGQVSACYAANNPYLDFDNSGWTTVIPYRYGDPRLSRYYEVMRGFVPYDGYLVSDITYTNGDWFAFVDDNNSGFYINANIGSSSTSNLRFNDVFPYSEESASWGLGINLRSSVDYGWIRVGGCTISSDNRVILWSITQGDATRATLGKLRSFDAATSATIIAWLDSLAPPVTADPYANGGISGPGGGDGSFTFTSTDIPIPTLPSIGAYNTGFISLYRPSATELHGLASYMWSSAFDLNNFIKIFANPGECILGLHIIPTSGTHPEGASATLTVGNISTGLSMTRLTEQYYECDCGTVTISPKWGAYLDYSPYSKLALFLPYIGFVPISPDDCMGGSIRVVYHVDVLSGSCCAYVYCMSNRGVDGHTLYTFTGSCACVCPVTEGQYTNGIIGSIRGGVGLAAGMLTGNILGGLEDAANALISMAKPDVNRSGSFGGSAGLMGIQYPYLVLTIPKMATPEEQNKYIGYPSFITTELSAVTGYASIKITHLEGMSATDEEITELVQLLEEGVIL